MPFLSSLDRFEGRYRAVSGLLFFNDVFMFKFLQKYGAEVKILQSKDSWYCYHSEDFWNVMYQHTLLYGEVSGIKTSIITYIIMLKLFK
jgi:hypothetical protein